MSRTVVALALLGTVLIPNGHLLTNFKGTKAEAIFVLKTQRMVIAEL